MLSASYQFFCNPQKHVAANIGLNLTTLKDMYGFFVKLSFAQLMLVCLIENKELDKCQSEDES